MYLFTSFSMTLTIKLTSWTFDKEILCEHSSYHNILHWWRCNYAEIGGAETGTFSITLKMLVKSDLAKDIISQSEMSLSRCYPGYVIMHTCWPSEDGMFTEMRRHKMPKQHPLATFSLYLCLMTFHLQRLHLLLFHFIWDLLQTAGRYSWRWLPFDGVCILDCWWTY